jgi:hypothetical protein
MQGFLRVRVEPTGGDAPHAELWGIQVRMMLNAQSGHAMFVLRIGALLVFMSFILTVLAASGFELLFLLR